MSKLADLARAASVALMDAGFDGYCVAGEGLSPWLVVVHSLQPLSTYARHITYLAVQDQLFAGIYLELEVSCPPAKRPPVIESVSVTVSTATACGVCGTRAVVERRCGFCGSRG